MSPDDRMLATGSNDGTLRLFDFASRRPLGVPLPGLPNRPVAPLFTPDGAPPARHPDVGPRLPLGRAAVVVGAARVRRSPAARSLAAEWADALPGRDYAPACG